MLFFTKAANLTGMCHFRQPATTHYWSHSDVLFASFQLHSVTARFQILLTGVEKG